MKASMGVVVVACAVLLLTACGQLPKGEKIPYRSMGVSVGPERVFDRPLAEVMPQLAGALATGENGRVGSELVFWSYRLADGRDVLFYACADLLGVDCEARTTRMCPVGQPQILTRGTGNGEVRKLDCVAIAAVGPGDLRPNCSDTEFTNPMLLGLAACP